jgi:hypothetical protein
MAEIKCPMCSKPNPAELDVCQFCEARLKPLTDELSRSQPPIHPGEEPTDMDTGQLEPVLPQWLREVRQQARDSAEEDAEQASAAEEASQPDEASDLLAGLQSQSDDEEVPDWLAGLRGEAGPAASEEPSTEEDDLAALRNMLGQDTPATPEPEASALPGWISDLGTEETDQADGDELSAFLADGTSEEPAQTESQPPASSSDLGWNADFETDSGLQPDTSEEDTPFETDLPAWLQGADETSKEESESGLPTGIGIEEPTPMSESAAAPPANEGDLPDWLDSLGDQSTEAAPQQDMEQPEAKSATDWLTSLGEETESISQSDTEQPEVKSTTDWLGTLGDETEAAPQQETAQPAAEGDMPDWLSSFGEESSEADSQQETEEPTEIGATTPDWLSSIGEETDESVAQEAVQPVGESELPDWLSSLGEEEPQKEDEEAGPAAELTETSQLVIEDETPDWLSSMDEETAESEQPAEQLETATLASDEPIDESEAAPVFVDDEGKPISTDDVESIFSMDMPDWLSDTEGLAEGDATMASADAQGDDLRPAELPSWVQAMRPVESVISESNGEPAEEQPMEEHGPLAGLRGVLPAVPGIGPSSKPEAYSLKLQASEDQQSNASMLEQMLAEEIHPKPVSAQKVMLTQRLFRWVIAVLLVVVVIIGNGTQINPMPTSAPLETSAALKYIQDTLPANAPVLLIFDYEAALAGELEASAAPLVDLMLTLKAPRLSLLSSTPVGAGLAERFIKPFTTSHNYQRGQQFINLGYLPGGAAGVLIFSENPISTKPLTTSGENAWATTVLQDVKNLPDFKAIILLTSDVDTARIWIEQTENLRGEAQFLVVSSAQAGPMILPYAQSGQVDGMITGIDGSAPIEQANSGRPGMVRRYWDAYGFGLLAAVSLITLGSLWSLVSSWQARRKEQDEE